MLSSLITALGMLPEANFAPLSYNNKDETFPVKFGF
jgi:hypothetical protein